MLCFDEIHIHTRCFVLHTNEHCVHTVCIKRCFGASTSKIFTFTPRASCGETRLYVYTVEMDAPPLSTHARFLEKLGTSTDAVSLDAPFVAMMNSLQKLCLFNSCHE